MSGKLKGNVAEWCRGSCRRSSDGGAGVVGGMGQDGVGRDGVGRDGVGRDGVGRDGVGWRKFWATYYLLG